MQNNTDDESRSQQQNETVQNLRTGMQDDTGLSAQAIADLRRKVKSGHYLTRDSAELSASRILDANETPIQ